MSEFVIKELLKTIPQIGKVEFISLRPERMANCISVEAVDVNENGLVGDHFKADRKKRAVTLIQSEHLSVVGRILNKEINPLLTRRNIVVSGINLLALKGQKFKIGSAILEGTGPCDPCTRMEENFGPGGYNAMRGHGGLTAQVIENGRIELGDTVQFIDEGN